MNYKELLEKNLNIELNEEDLSKVKYLKNLEKLKNDVNVVIPDDYVLEYLENNDVTSIMEYAVEKSGGDSSNINMEEIDLFVMRLYNGFYLLKYIEEIEKR